LSFETVKLLYLSHFAEHGDVLFIPGHPRFIARPARILIGFYHRRPHARKAPQADLTNAFRI
jgi:hypothetical protein